MRKKFLRITRLMQELGVTPQMLIDYWKEEEARKLAGEADPIREKLVDIVAEKCDLSPSEIGDETSFSELGADSLDVVEIVFEAEKQYKVDISDTEFERLRTFGDLVLAVKLALK